MIFLLKRRFQSPKKPWHCWIFYILNSWVIFKKLRDIYQPRSMTLRIYTGISMAFPHLVQLRFAMLRRQGPTVAVVDREEAPAGRAESHTQKKTLEQWGKLIHFLPRNPLENGKIDYEGYENWLAFN